MEWDVILGPVATGVQSVITDVVPIAVPVLLALAGISIALGVFRKFGVRR